MRICKWAPSSCQPKLLVCDSQPSPLRLLHRYLSPLSGPLSCLGRRRTCVHVWPYGPMEYVVVLHSAAVPHSYRELRLTGKTCSCSQKLKVASAIQISVQQAFGVVCFFQAPRLFPTHLQKLAVAYPKGHRAFSRIMRGKRQHYMHCLFSIVRLHGKLENGGITLWGVQEGVKG